MELRAALIADADLLFEWRKQAELAPWWNGIPADWDEHVQWMSARLGSPACRLWILEDDGKPVGCGRLDSNGEATVLVAPDQRGKGLGATLLRIVCEHAAALGHNRVKASVDAANVSARGALLKAGFEERDDVKFYLWRPE